MQTYISMLRGINVSGQKKIEMAGLRSLYEELSFEQVTTYIQSGNVIFKTANNANEGKLVETIEQAIHAKYGFEVPVTLRNLPEINELTSNNPFLTRMGIDPEKLHVTFLSNNPQQSSVKNIETAAFLPDEFILSGKEIFLYCPGGYGNTKLNNKFF